MIDDLPEGTVTVLFTDIEGSTGLRTRRGDEAAQAIMRAKRDLLRRQVERHSGREVKGLGDGYMVAFSSARRAVDCAAAIQRTTEEHNLNHPDQEIHLRIGLNAGEVLKEEEDLFGAAVNAAARIAARAKGGQVLVSRLVKDLVGPGSDVVFADRGRLALKGLPGRWQLFELAWREATASASILTILDRTPFVGREAELAVLVEALSRARAGEGQFVALAGEPGVGKTRLADELAAEARRLGMLTLEGHCYEMQGTPPYIPFVEALESIARSTPAASLREALGDGGPHVAKLMPALRQLFPDITEPIPVPPEQERRFLFNSVYDLFGRAARGRPVYMKLEDLHWADESTLLLLQHIAQRLPEAPILIVATYRQLDIDAQHPLSGMLEELIRRRLVHNLSLKRFPSSGVEAMLQAMSGQSPPRHLVDAIYAETDGNAFFIEEVFKYLAEDGRLFDSSARWRSDLAIEDLDVPQSVRLVLERRMARVSDHCRRALTAAAVIGRAFSFDLLATVKDANGELLNSIDEAERTHLITSAGGDAPSRYTFAHELTRQTLLAGAPTSRRQRLHLEVANALERTAPGPPEERAADIAYHLHRAGSLAESERTALYLSLAGDQALATAAYERALEQYERALSHFLSREGTEYAGLLFKRGLALRRVGRWEDAIAGWREALSACEQAGETDEMGRYACDICFQLDWGGHYADALQIARRTLASLGETASGYRAVLLASCARTLSLGGSYEQAEQMIEEATELAKGLTEPKLLGRLLTDRAHHHYAHYEITQQTDAALEAAELFRSTGELWGLTNILWVAQVGLFVAGRPNDAATIGDELELLANKLGHPGALLVAGRVRGMHEVMLAPDFARFEAFAHTDIELCQRTGLPWGSAGPAYLGLAAFWSGGWDEAARHFQDAVDAARPGFLEGSESALLLLHRAYSGNRDEVIDIYSRIAAALPKAGEHATLGHWAMLLLAVEGLAIAGQRGEAASLYDAVLSVLRLGAQIRLPDVKLIEGVAGIAAAAAARWEEAQGHYEKALRQAEELPHLMEQSEVRRWYARMLLERDAPGDREAGRRMAEEAAAMYTRLGMTRHVLLAQAMLT